MNASTNAKFFASIPYDKNSTLHLIMGIGSIYILMHIIYVVFIILSNVPGTVYYELMLPNTAIRDWEHFAQKPWTLFIYGISHSTFWIMFTNMVWLYLFGNVLQQYVGYKEIIPLYFFVYILAGFAYLIITFLIPNPQMSYFQGAIVSNIGIATAALYLRPNHQMSIGSQLRVPYVFFYIIFFLLSIFLLINDANAYGFLGKLQYTWYSYVWILYIMSVLMGLTFGILYNKGMKLGNLMYAGMDKLVLSFTPAHNADGWRTDKLKNAILSQDRVKGNPELKKLVEKLDKEGITALSAEERIKIFGQ